MMFLLLQDITAHILNGRLAHRESAIPFLPLESTDAEFRVNPLG